MSAIQLMYIYYWLRKLEDEDEDRITKLLGVRWKVKEIREANKDNKGAKKTYTDDDEILIPLALAINPNLMKGLGEMVGGATQVAGGEYQPKSHEKVIDTAQMSSEDYKAFLSKSLGTIFGAPPKQK